MLYISYEPRKFSDVIGQEQVKLILQRIIDHDYNVHGIILTGKFGTGKTLLAKLFACHINCDLKTVCTKCKSCIETMKIFESQISMQQVMDISIIDGATHNGVDHIREILSTVVSQPLYLKKRIVIIDEAHMLSKSAMEALLIQLQNSPSHVIFIFTTTDIHKITDTLRSRCIELNLSSLSSEQMKSYMTNILEKEGMSLTHEQMEMLIMSSQGSLRYLLSSLQKLLLLQTNNISQTAKLLQVITMKQIENFFLNVMSGNMIEIKNIWNNLSGISGRHFLTQFMKFLCECMQWKRNQDNMISMEFQKTHEKLKDVLTMSLLFQFIDITLDALNNLEFNEGYVMTLFFEQLMHVEDSNYISYRIQNYWKLKDILQKNN